MSSGLAYITRKYPPSIGGMQCFNEKLVAHLKQLGDFHLLSWGRSQALMPLFLVYVFFKVVWLKLTGRVQTIYLSDALMSPLGLIFKKLFSMRVLVTAHGRDATFTFPGYRWAVGRSLRQLDGVICVSRHTKDYCLRMGVDEKILSVIPNGVSVEDFAWKEDTHPDRCLGLNLAGKTVLLSVGRLVPRKGMDRFVSELLPEIVRRHPQTFCLIVGDGPLRKKIQSLVAERGLEDHVRLLVDIPWNDPRLTAAYNCARIFVMPNVPVKGDVEGFGIVVLEAAAAGCVVVASRLEGIEEAIEDGANGILVRWDDNAAFLNELLRLAEDPEMAGELGRKARRFVEDKYDWKKIARLYHQVFNQSSAALQA